MDRVVQSDEARILRETLDCTRQGIVRFDASLRLVLANHALRDLLELPEQLLTPGTSLEDIARFHARRGDYGPGDAEEHVATRLAAARSPQPESFESRRGDHRILDARQVPLDDGGLLLTYNDVTAIRRADAARRMADSRFRALFENSPVSTQIVGADGRTLYVNAAWERLWGVGLADLQAAGYDLRNDPQLKQHGVQELVLRAFAGEAVAVPPVPYDPRAVLDNLRADVETRWVRGLLFPVKDDNGAVVEVIITHEDVTAHKRAEADRDRVRVELEERVRERTIALQSEVTERRRAVEALQESQERYQLAVEGTNEGLWDWNVTDDTLYLSPRAREILGIEDLEHMPSRRWLEAIHPHDRRRFRAAVIDHLRGNSAFFTVDVRLTGEPVRWVRDRGLARRGPDGRVYRMAGSVGDITETKRAMHALRIARDQSELANRAKSEFLANMSHELRTPLNAIIGFSDVVLSGVFGALANEKYREYIANIHESGKHLLELVNDILDVSVIEAGRLDLHVEEANVDSLAESALRLVRPRADNNRVRLELAIDCGLAPVRVDARRIKQILVNLLSNAVKFTPAGGRVVLSASVGSQGGIDLAVEDTGIGMNAEGIAKALTPFGQVESAFSKRMEGTGLGLPLTMALIEAHGGHLQVDSEPGRGTRVVVHVPGERVVVPDPG